MNKGKKSTVIFVLSGLLIGISLWFFCLDASAQSMWKPSKTVQMVGHGNGPGTSGDVTLRNMFQILKEEGFLPPQQQIQWVYKPGGSSTICQAYVVEQKGNDHLLAQWSTTWIGAAIATPGMKHSLKAMTLINRYSTEPTVVAVNPDSPLKNITDLIAAARARPSQLKQAGGSITSVDNMYRLLIMGATGVKWDFMPMPAGGERIAAILGGNADIMLGQLNEMSEYVRAGKLRLICSLTSERQDEIPQVATPKEAGLNIPLLITSRGFVAPPGVSTQVVDYWVDIFRKMYKTARWKKFLKDSGLEEGLLYGAELNNFMNDQYTTMTKLMTESGMVK